MGISLENFFGCHLTSTLHSLLSIFLMTDWAIVFADILTLFKVKYKAARGNPDLRAEILAQAKVQILQDPRAKTPSTIFPERNLRVV